MARWRDRPQVTVPAWVLETDVDDPLWPMVEAWLDELQAHDPLAWEAAIVKILSTPSRTA